LNIALASHRHREKPVRIATIRRNQPTLTSSTGCYALRNRIERFFNRAKNSRRVATRYDKLIESFAAFVLLACIRVWIRFVHTT
jgi:transposase